MTGVSAELAGYVLALRRAAPLATATDGFPDNRPVEAVAARDVVDGLALLDRWRPDPEAFFTGTPDLPASGPDRDDLKPSWWSSTTFSTPLPTCSWRRACTRWLRATTSGPAPRSTPSTGRPGCPTPR